MKILMNKQPSGIEESRRNALEKQDTIALPYSVGSNRVADYERKEKL